MMNLFKYMMILMSCWALAACSSSRDNTIVIGYDNTFVPMGFLSETGEVTGFDVDLATEALNRLGLDFTFQSINWSMKETELNAQNIDLIWNGYSLTEERKRQVAYTEPYLKNKQIIITLSDSGIQTIDDLKNKVVGTQQGSASLEAVEKNKALLTMIQGQTPILYETFDQAFRDLEIGRIDALVADEVLARYYMNQKQTSNLLTLHDDLGEESFVIACRQIDTELCSRLSETLEDMKIDGTFEQIYNNWFLN